MYNMQKSNADRKANDLLGEQALSLLKVYDEGERASFFLEQATRFAIGDARNVLGENGGYGAQNGCQRLLGDSSFVVLHSCSSFNPEKEFYQQLVASSAGYLQWYESTYKQYVFEQTFLESLQRTLGLLDDPITLNLNHFYTQNVQKATLLPVVLERDTFRVAFSPLTYVPELAQKGATYVVTPKMRYPREDFAVYNQAFSVAQFCLRKSVEACQDLFRQAFPQSVLASDGNVVKVVIPSEKETIKFALDPNKALPFKEVASVA